MKIDALALPNVSVGQSATDWGGKNAKGKAKPTYSSGQLQVDRNMKGGSTSGKGK